MEDQQDGRGGSRGKGAVTAAHPVEDNSRRAVSMTGIRARQELACVASVDGKGAEAVEEGLGVGSGEEGRRGVLACQGGAA